MERSRLAMVYKPAFIIIAILLSGCMGKTAIDSSSDLRVVKIPPHWRAECVDSEGNLRTDSSPVTQQACKDISANNLILKSRRKG